MASNTKNNDTLKNDENSEIAEQIAQLRADITKLAGSLKTLSDGVKNEVKSQAHRIAEDAIDATERTADHAKKQVKSLNDTLVEQVQSNPIQALGIAAAAGFVLAILSRR